MGARSDHSLNSCDGDGRNVIILIVGISSFLVLSLIAVFFLYKLDIWRRRGSSTSQNGNGGGIQNASIAMSEAEVANRKQIIDSYLISKKCVSKCAVDELENAENGRVDSAPTTVIDSDTSSQESNDCGSTPSSGIPEAETGRQEERGITTFEEPQVHEASGPGMVCHICLEVFESDDELVQSNISGCQHLFHRTCIVEWLLRQDKCPCCRANFLPGEGEEGDEGLIRNT